MKLGFSRVVFKLATLLPVASIAFLTSSCATTINESAPTTQSENSSNGISVSQATVTTIDLQLDRDELLVQMLQNIDSLSDAMQKSDRKTAANYLDQINLINDVLRPKIVKLSDQLAADFDRVVALAKSSVERNRPADADKALRFLPLIIDSLKNF